MISILSFNVIKDALTALLFAYFVAYLCEKQLRDKQRSIGKVAFPSETACTESGKGGTGNFGQVAG
jgi:hypothetical protein